MKKLFATLLAATMVAGMSVSVFASTGSTYETTDFGGEDYAVIGAYDSDGNKIKDAKSNRLDSGDKIYYPILISGDELEDESLVAGNMYFANKASEVDKLKAYVKDEIGGKYIDGAAIIRKDININAEGLNDKYETFTADLSDVKADDVAAKEQIFTVKIGAVTGTIGKGDTVTLQLTGGESKKVTLEASADADAIATALGNEQWTNYNTSVSTDTITFTAKNPGVAGGAVTGATTTFKDMTSSSATLAVATYAQTQAAANKTINDVTVDIIAGSPVSVPVTKEDDNAAFLNALNGKIIDDYKVTDISNPEKVKFVKQTAGNDSPVNVIIAGTTQGNATQPIENNTNGQGTGTKVGKIYCVEVKLSDYFKNEETEVEFNIRLKDGGKEVYDTEDNHHDFWGSFDLGSDAELLKANTFIGGDAARGRTKRFKNGDLELEITNKTGAVILEEAKLLNDKKEDVDYIYLEGKDVPVTFEVKASGQDDLFLSVNKDANKKVVISNQDAKMSFVNFDGKPDFDFTGTAKFTVEDPDVKYYLYEIVDDKPVKTSATYNKEDECFELRTRTLGSYVISDKELEAATNPADKDATDKPATDKPTTEKPVNPTTPDKNVPTGAIA